MKLGYSMQDWFLRISFAPSSTQDGITPCAETHNVGLNNDFDVVVNSEWLAVADEKLVEAILRHECEHAIQQFLNSRRKRSNGQGNRSGS